MKKALVTGSTKGIGRAIGQELLYAGCKVAFNYSADISCAKELCKALDELGYQQKYKIVRADLSNIEGAKLLIDQVLPEFAPLDHLVLNAGATWRGTLADLKIEDWERVMRVNLTVPLFLTQMCAPYMAEGGSILFIGSIMGKYPHTMSIPYGVSKAGVSYMAQCLVKEFSAERIRVNCLCPGFVDTTWQKEKPEMIRNSIQDKVALHRFAKPDEIAQIARAILENPYMNGSVVTVDGGYCYQ